MGKQKEKHLVVNYGQPIRDGGSSGSYTAPVLPGAGGKSSSNSGIPDSPYGNASKVRLKFFDGAGTGAGWHEDFDFDEIVPSNIGMLGKLHYGVAADNSLKLIRQEHQRQMRESPAVVQANVNAAIAAANAAQRLSPAQTTARDKAIVDGFIEALAIERREHQVKANEYFGNDPLAYSVNDFTRSLPALQGGHNVAPYKSWVASNTAAYSVKVADALIGGLSQQSNALAQKLFAQHQAEQAAQLLAQQQAQEQARQQAAAERARQQAKEAANTKAEQARQDASSQQQTILNAITAAPAVTASTQGAAAALDGAFKSAAQALGRALASSLPAVLMMYPSELGNGELAPRFTVAPLDHLNVPAGLDLQQIASGNGSVEVSHRLDGRSSSAGSRPQWIKTGDEGPDSSVRVRTADYDPETNTYSFTPDGHSEPALVWTPIVRPGDSSTTTSATPIAGPSYSGSPAGPLELPAIEIREKVETQGLDDYILVAGPESLYLVLNQRPGDHKYHPKPANLPAFPDAKRAPSKTPVRGGGKLRPRWKDSDKIIYEWDFQHGTLEQYDKRGNHLGEYDHETGMQTKPADPTRSIEP